MSPVTARPPLEIVGLVIDGDVSVLFVRVCVPVRVAASMIDKVPLTFLRKNKRPS